MKICTTISLLLTLGALIACERPHGEAERPTQAPDSTLPPPLVAAPDSTPPAPVDSMPTVTADKWGNCDSEYVR